MKYVNSDIVFREIPDETTLAINISNCPHRCRGCHSAYLQQNIGITLNESTLAKIIDKYEKSITCICFMGGDAEPETVSRLAGYVKEKWCGILKTAWYSGSNAIHDGVKSNNFDFIKLGEYVEALGNLETATTNQRLYRIKDAKFEDITELIRKHFF